MRASNTLRSKIRPPAGLTDHEARLEARPHLCSRLVFTVALLSLASCPSTPNGTITIVTGDEVDAFSRSPAPVTLVTEKVAEDGSRQQLARSSLPADTIDLGKLSSADVGGIAASALDPAGKPLLRGQTLLVEWGALEFTSLSVFVQRTGELARMPSGPAAFDAAHAATVLGRYVVATYGTASVVYDLLLLQTLAAPPALPRAAKSMAIYGSALLLVDETGATSYDLSDGTTVPVDPPTGGTFTEIVGGDRTEAKDGTQFVVGATRRTGGPTPRILMLDTNGKATFAALAAPRDGACATWVEGRGLVVIGGDPTAAGAEVLAPGATVATPLPFPADPIRGCAATTLDNTHVLVAGGTGAGGATPAFARVLDLGCTTACTPSPWPAQVPTPLVHAQAITLAPDAAFILGDDATGASHAYRITSAPNASHEVALRLPRRGAQMTTTPIGAIAVVGGAAGIEQYLE
jgi:hypothetical protein